MPVDTQRSTAPGPAAGRHRPVAEQLQQVRNSADLGETSRRRPLSDASPPEIDSKRNRPSFDASQWRHRWFDAQLKAGRHGWMPVSEVSTSAARLLQTEDGVENATQLFEKLQQKFQDARLQPEVGFYNAMILIYVKAGDAGRAWKLVDDMQQQDRPVAPDVVTFNHLMSNHAKQANWDGIKEVLLAMEAQRPPVRPSCVTYGMLIDAHATDGNGKAGEDLLRAVIRRAEHEPSLRVGNKLWGSAINAYAESGDGPNAERLYREGQAQEQSDDWRLSTVMKGYAKVGDGPNAERLLKEWVKPGIILYNTAIHAYTKAGDWKNAERLFLAMRAQDPPLAPDLITYSTAISALQKAGRTAGASGLIEDAIASGVFAPTAGYYRNADRLDFHLGAVMRAYWAEDNKAVPAPVALALMDYHASLKNLTSKTRYAVGRRGYDVIKDAVLGKLNQDGEAYIVDPYNSGQLIPKQT